MPLIVGPTLSGRPWATNVGVIVPSQVSSRRIDSGTAEPVSPGCRQVGGGVDEHVDAVQVPSFERRRGEGPFGDVDEGVSGRHVVMAVSEQSVACFAKGVVDDTSAVGSSSARRW